MSDIARHLRRHASDPYGEPLDKGVAPDCAECGCDISDEERQANAGLCDDCDWARNGGAE